MRGLFEEAVSAFELVIVEEKSTDPAPYFRIARIYRDDMERYEDAARWFKRALDEADMHAGHQALARKELVELYRVKLGMPQKAAPMLRVSPRIWRARQTASGRRTNCATSSGPCGSRRPCGSGRTERRRQGPAQS